VKGKIQEKHKFEVFSIQGCSPTACAFVGSTNLLALVQAGQIAYFDTHPSRCRIVATHKQGLFATHSHAVSENVLGVYTNVNAFGSFWLAWLDTSDASDTGEASSTVLLPNIVNSRTSAAHVRVQPVTGGFKLETKCGLRVLATVKLVDYIHDAATTNTSSQTHLNS
jgi:hypothetical protein